MKKIIIVSILIITGCTSPYSKFYVDKTGGVDITKSTINTGDVEVRHGANVDSDIRSMLENNYGLIGFSSFNASNVSDDGAISKAKEVHASVLILYSQYSGTKSGYTPLTLPNTTTSSTTLNGNIYNQRSGNTSYSGVSNTTYNGTNTTYIPYSITNYDYVASYWVKTKPRALGVIPKELAPEIHKKLGSNKGLLVDLVVKDSPAFYADIFTGDMLMKIGDDVIYDEASLSKSVSKNAGKEVDVLLIRDDKEIHKLIKLRSLPQ